MLPCGVPAQPEVRFAGLDEALSAGARGGAGGGLRGSVQPGSVHGHTSHESSDPLWACLDPDKNR